jgi:2-polyprenyl-3-methyl-5-hydroxy-6-metoxy-1,4-benzoquinol methylase
MPDLTHRSHEVEIMDDLQCSGEVVHQTLRELEKINYLLGGNYVTINGIEVLLKYCSNDTPIHIADLGCGSGDILRLIRRWANKKGYNVRLTGIDANTNIVAFAKERTEGSLQIVFDSVDIFSEKFKEKKFDVVIGTLFFHHFSNEQLTSFFQQLKQQVRIGVIINDIHRHWLSFYSIKILTSVFSKSTMVKYDAPLSVKRAFKKQELKSILDSAGLKKYSIRWMWAFRWQVIIYFR